MEAPVRAPSMTAFKSPLRDAWETIEHFGFSGDTAPVLAHFQVADSVHAVTAPEKVYYLCNRGVACYDLEQRKASIVFATAERFGALAVGHGYVAAGHYNSLLVWNVLSKNVCLEVGPQPAPPKVGTIHIYKHGEDIRILVTPSIPTKPGVVRVYSLRTGQKVTELTYPTSVASATTSPDGRWLVAVGEGMNVYLCSLTDERGVTHGFGALRTLLLPWHAQLNSSRHVTWDAKSEHVAVCHDASSSCFIGNVTSLEVVADLNTTDAPYKAAKFGPECSRLLVALKNRSAVDGYTIIYIFSYDSKMNFTRLMHLQFMNVNATGIAFTSDCSSLVIGLANRGFLEVRLPKCESLVDACIRTIQRNKNVQPWRHWNVDDWIEKFALPGVVETAAA